MKRSVLPLWNVNLFDGPHEHWTLARTVPGLHEKGPERVSWEGTEWTEWRLHAASADEAIRIAKATLPQEPAPRDVLAAEIRDAAEQPAGGVS